ncbi:MAG: cell wall metabolism sensor histidine kinase WalK [Alicyclobacillus sp.]|nr:cell wall metabolism sensor histidine kinase WalK [Alicyclobacillus sp.]
MSRLASRISGLAAAALGAGFLCASLLALVFVERVQLSALRHTLADEARAYALSIAQAVKAAGPGEGPGAAAARAARSLVIPAGEQVAVRAPDGTLWAVVSGSVPASEAAAAKPADQHTGPGAGTSPLVSASAPVVTDGRPVAQVTVSSPRLPADVRLLLDWAYFCVGLALLFSLVALVSRRFARSLARPVERLADAAERAAAGEPGPRPHVWGPAEAVRIAGAIRALTDQLVAKREELAQVSSKLDGVVSNMGAGVLAVDRAGRISLINQTAARLLPGLGARALLRDHREALDWPELSALVDHALSRGEPAHAELRSDRSGGRSLDVHAAPARGSQGSVAGVVVVLHDVTAWRRVVEMRSEFVANASHELRSPITAIQGFAETLLDGAVNDPEAARQFLQVIHEEAVRIGRLVDDLLDLSKMESGHSVFRFQPADVRGIVRRVADRFRHQADRAGIRLDVYVPDQPVEAEVAPDRIEQVLVNLVSNALAYTPQGGRVELRAENGWDEVRLTVEDTGIGIPEADLPHIFERFYRVDKARSRHSGGTGLGLAIVKHIVEAHEGRVEVRSQPGAGSSFTAVLPKRRTVRG